MSEESKIKVSDLQELIDGLNLLFNEYLTDEETLSFEKAIENIYAVINRLEDDED